MGQIHRKARLSGGNTHFRLDHVQHGWPVQAIQGVLGIVSVSGAGCAERMEVKGDSRELFSETLTGAHNVDLDVSGISLVTVSASIAQQGEGDCQAGLGEPIGVA